MKCPVYIETEKYRDHSRLREHLSSDFNICQIYFSLEINKMNTKQTTSPLPRWGVVITLRN